MTTKCTLIQRMDGKATVVKPGLRKLFLCLEDAEKFIRESGWEVNIVYGKARIILSEDHSR